MRVPLRAVRAVVAAGSRPLGRPVPVAVQRAWLEATSALGRLPAGTTVEATTLAGRPAERVAGPSPDPARAVLLLHGGAFILGSPRTHRVLAAHLAHAAGAAVHVLDHRRAPEHPHPAAVDDADAALAHLEAEARTAVVGDSAGGALALLLAIRRRDEGRTGPAALGLISPVVDLTLELSTGWTGPDPLLRLSWIRQGRDAYAAGHDPVDLSPLHLPLHDLPPAYVQVSSDERLRPEGERLIAALRAAGGDVDGEVLPGLWHDAHVHAHLVPEAADAVARLGRWVAERSS